MLFDIETALTEIEAIRFPVVYVRPEVDKTLSNKIKDIITNHQGEVTEDEEEATHIIFPVADPLAEEYARPSFKRDKHVMLHWYYLPESYDSWVVNNFDLPVSYSHNNELLKKCLDLRSILAAPHRSISK